MSEQIATRGISSLRELRDVSSSSSVGVKLIQPELNGGKTSPGQLDALLASGSSVVTVSGLDQATFEYMIARYGRQITAVHLWKCPRIADFTPFEDVQGLTQAAFFWNQQATRLWDFSKTPLLMGLFFEDFKRVEDLGDLATAESLRELEFGNGFTGKTSVQSLEPLSELISLQSLRFNPRSILDGQIRPLAKLTNLVELQFPGRLFTTEQIAWLRAHLPPSLTSESLEPTRAISVVGAKFTKDVLINGKGKPFLSSDKDAARVRRYISDFEVLVQHFLRNPKAMPSNGT